MDSKDQKRGNDLSILVRDRSGIIFEGNADSVSSVNEHGEFDVLALHANFISLIRNELILRVHGAIIKRFPITSGLVKVAENRVEVYLGVVRSRTTSL